MTADEWDTTRDLEELLAAAGLEPGGRRLRLFGAACAARVADAMPDDAARELVRLAVRRADGGLSEPDWMAAVAVTLDPYLGNEAARDGAGGATFGVLMNLYQADGPHTLRLAESVVEAVAYRAFVGERRSWGGVGVWTGGEDASRRAAAAEVDAVCGLFRCVVGNPVRPVVFSPEWRTAAAAGLAEGIYRDAAFDRLPILADALQDAGCELPAVLAHCRAAGPHARGCWVVDAVLGRT